MALHLQKVGWRVAVEAQSWSLAQVRLLVYCCGLMEMGVLAPLVLAMVEVKRLQRVDRGTQGAMLQMDVLWTSLGGGPLILVEFHT